MVLIQLSPAPDFDSNPQAWSRQPAKTETGQTGPTINSTAGVPMTASSMRLHQLRSLQTPYIQLAIVIHFRPVELTREKPAHICVNWL